MGAALRRVDVVDIGEKAFRKAVGILDGGTADDGIPSAFEVDDILLQRIFPGIQVTDVIRDAAVVAEDAGAAFGVGKAFVRKGDADALVEVGKLLQAARDGLGLETDVLEDLIIREETDQGALFPRVADDLQRADRLAGRDFLCGGIVFGGKSHAVVRPVEEHIHGEPLAQRVDDAGTHTVETAGIVVVFAVELAAGVQDGKDDFDTGNMHGRMLIHRHAAAVVPHRSGSVLMQGDGYLIGEAVGRLVDGVVHNLPQQVMQAAGGRGSDVHAGTHADGFQAFQHLNIPGVIGLRCHGVTP